MGWEAVPFNCKQCSKEQKKARGCVRPTKKKAPIQWKIRPCYRCNGEDDRCKLCKGTNEVLLNRCPIALSKGEGVSSVISSISAYRKFGIYPNGKPAIFQAVKFLTAIDVFDKYSNIFENQYRERKMKEWQQT